MSVRIYLAGPDIFYPNAEEIGNFKKEKCKDFGFEGLWPLDGTSKYSSPKEIFHSCEVNMRCSNYCIANLTPFDGVSADAGTCFELGYLYAIRKPLFAYSLDKRKFEDRGTESTETFGLFDNLMIDVPLSFFITGDDYKELFVKSLEKVCSYHTNIGKYL